MKNLINYLSKKSLSLGNGSGMTRKRLGNDSGMTRFSLVSLICVLMLTLGVGNAWGATATMTGLTQATSSTVNSKAAIKCGTGSYAGSMKVTVPANATVLALYCAGWNGASVTINITPSAKVSPSSFNPTSDSGISGSGTSYTLSGSESTYLKTITLSSITSSTDITFANTAKKKQFVIWGARYVFNPTSPTNGTPTSNSEHVSWSYANSTDKYEIYYSTSSSAPTAETAATTGYGYSTIGTTKSADLTGLTANTTYYWWVRAVDPDGYCKSAWVAGSSFTTSSGSCTEPHHVDVGTQWGWFKGETLSLSATAYSTSGSGSPIDAGDITGYQWYKGGTAEGNKIAGATSATYTKASCTLDDAGDYYCKVSTGATCSTMSSAFGVKIYSLECYTGGTTSYNFTRVGSTQTGTVQIDLAANSSYQFKVRQGSSYYGNKGTITEDENTWEFNGNNDHDGNVTVTTYTAGKFTFTLDYSANGASPILAVTYPARTLYLQLCSDWKAASAKYAIYYWRTATGWSDDFMTATTCDADILYTSIPSWAQNVIFVRFNPSKGSTGNYDDEWNRTGDLALAYNKDYYHTLSKGGDNKYYGTWGTYTIPTYTISYAKGTVPTGGGSISGSRDDESKTCGTAFTLPSSAVFTTTGYTQDGWATEDGGSKDYNLGGSYTTNAAQAFYPHWNETLHNVTVAYKCGETTVKASTSINNVGIATTGSTTAPDDITGYTWSTWSAMPSGVTTSTTPLTTRAITINATADSKTITANYTANVYNITYKDKDNATYSGDKTDGVPTGAPTIHTYGSATALVNGTKTGYTFGGWYTDASCTVSAGSSIGATAKTADFTLYAKWTATSYTLSYDLAGGSVASPNPTNYTIESAAITLNNPTRNGYTFAGWTGTGLASATETVTIAAGSTGNRSYTATWTAKEDTYKTALHTSAAGWTTYASGVTKSGAGYTIPAPSSVTKGATSSCEDTHYHFAGWVADEYKGSPSGHIIAASGTTDATGTTYWAVWEKEGAGGASLTKLTSSYEPQEGDNLVIVAKGTSYALYQETTNTSYVNKWSFENSAATVGSDDKNYITLESDGEGDWYLGDETNGYIYTSSSNNLEVNKSGSKTAFTFGTEVVDAVTYFTFTSGRWLSYRSDLGTPNYRLGGTNAKASGASGNALFDLYKYVGVSFEDPKAVCEACVATPSISGVSLMGTAFTTTSVPVQATGASAGENCSLAEYGFYWGGSANPTTNETASDNLSTGTFSATLTGPFEIGTTYHYRAFGTNEADNTGYSSDATFTLHNVTFNMHDHGDAKAAQVVPEGGKVTNPGDPSEAGWTFGGWWANSTFSGSAWDFSTNTVGSGDLVLHAKWTEKPKYTITLNAGNGTISDANWTNTSGSTYTRTQANGDEEITLPTPSCNCAGWVFQGWSTTSKDNAVSFTPDKTDGASFVPGSNVTYYAVYRQNASGGTTYNKITSTGDLTTGDYLFVANGGYAMKNAVTSNRMEEVSGFASSEPSLTTENSAIVWTIIKFSSQVVIKNGSNYIGIDANNKICLTTTPHFFTYTYNGTNSRWEFTSAAKTDYQLAYSTAHGGAYAYFCIGTSQSTAIYLYKQGAGLTGNYYTNPTCSDYTINGVADPAAGGTVTLSAASAKTDDKVYALYTLNKDYNFVDWEISGTGSTLSSTTALITEITVGSANTTVTANFELKEWAVTWKANGETLTGGDLGDATTRADTDEDITELPPSPSSCDGTSTTFMGWVEESEIWSGKTDDVSEVTIYSKVSDFPAVTGNVTYHAVWAKRNGSAAPATYAGTGTFTRITTLEELEVNAHYVLYGIKDDDPTNVKGAMNNTYTYESTGKYTFGVSSVSISDNKITNPATTIVWKLGGTKDAYTLYSQNSSKYVEITSNDTRGYTNPSSATTSFTIKVSDGNFKIVSNHASANNRMITIYDASAFRAYSELTEGYTLNLYKYGNDYTYNKYLVKCCEDPELAFDGEYNYQTLVRQDIHGARGGNGSATVEQGKATLVLDYATESGGTCSVEVKKLTGVDNRSTAVAGSDCSNHTNIAINQSTKKVTFDIWTYAPSYPTANGQGTYRIKITQDAASTYCASEAYYFVDVTLRDKFVDAVNGNETINVDGQSKSTSDKCKTPTEASLDADKNDDCHSTTRRFLGWVREDNMDTWYGSSSDRTRDLDDKKDDAALVAPNADIITSGSTWYAIWGIEE